MIADIIRGPKVLYIGSEKKDESLILGSNPHNATIDYSATVPRDLNPYKVIIYENPQQHTELMRVELDKINRNNSAAYLVGIGHDEHQMNVMLFGRCVNLILNANNESIKLLERQVNQGLASQLGK